MTMQPGMMGPDMTAKMQGMMEMMHSMLAGGMMRPDMMAKMHAMMSGGMMTSTASMSVTHSGGMMMQPGQMRQGMMQQPDMMRPDMTDMMGPDMMRKMQGPALVQQG